AGPTKSSQGNSASPASNDVLCGNPSNSCQASAGSYPTGAPGSASMARRLVRCVTTAATNVAAANDGIHHRILARDRRTSVTKMTPAVSGRNIDGATAVLTANRIA